MRQVRLDVLAIFLRLVASNSRSKLPGILKGRFQSDRLREIVREYLKRLNAANNPKPPESRDKPNWGGLAVDLISKQTAVDEVKPLPWKLVLEAAIYHEIKNVEDARSLRPNSLVESNWPEVANRILGFTKLGQGLPEEARETPWKRVMRILKRKWEGPSFSRKYFTEEGVFVGYIREWIVRDGDFPEPDERTTQLAQLDRLGLQNDLLRDMRAKFPQEANDWFGSPEAQEAGPELSPEKIPSGASSRGSRKRGGPVDPNPEEDGQTTLPLGAIIISHGNRQYSMAGHTLLTVDDNEDSVLQAFLTQPSMNHPTLIQLAGFDCAPRVLKGLTEKYNAVFALAVRLPRRKGAGGYTVAIQRASAAGGGINPPE